MVQALVDHLPQLAPDLQFLFLRHPAKFGSLSNAANVTERVVPWATNGPASMWFLPYLADLSDIDLFHAPSNILPMGLGMPCITTVHDVMWLTDPELCNPKPWGLAEKAFYCHGMRHAMARSTIILTVSEATRTALIDLEPALAARCRAVLPGVSERFVRRATDPAEIDRIGVSRPRYVLTVGQNAPYKNHMRVLEAFASAFSSDQSIGLVLVQRQGASTSRLQKLATQLGIADRVDFLAPVDEDTLVTLYNGATALLHPSLCEGFGMPIAEAMACGCPVITSNRSAMPEVAAGAALLVDPEDTASIASALRRIASDPALASGLVERGIARARMLDWRNFAAANLDAYRTVLEPD